MHGGRLDTVVILRVTVSGRDQEGEDVFAQRPGLELCLTG